jgi:acyl-CoA thioester hydrolase
MFNEKGDKLNEGETTLVFVDAASKRPCGAPEAFLDALNPFFNL